MKKAKPTRPIFRYMAKPIFRDIIEREGRTKAWVSRQLGTTPGGAWMIVCGKRGASEEQSLTMSRLLGRERDELFDRM